MIFRDAFLPLGLTLLSVFICCFAENDHIQHPPIGCFSTLDEEEDVSVVQLTLGSRHRSPANSKRIEQADKKTAQSALVGKGNRSHASVVDETATTTNNPEAKLKTEVEQVANMPLNAAGDLPEFLSVLTVNSILLFASICFFMVMYKRFPNIYAFRATGAWGQQAQIDAPHTWTSGEKTPWLLWLRMSYRTTVEEMIETCGLDAAFLVRFTVMAMEILSGVCIPGLLFTALYCHMGGNAAGDDKLGHLGIGNVQHDSWIFWLVPFLVWYNVMFIQLRLFRWQRYFIKHRTDWLLRMPYPRNCTVMVEGIDDQHCSDTALRRYFEDVYGPGEIRDVFVVKKLHTLKVLIEEYKTMDQLLHQAKFKKAGEEELKYYEQQQVRLAISIMHEQNVAREEADKSPEESDIYATCGFVTFADRRNSEQALSTRLCVDEDFLVMSIPPDPMDVIYDDLEMPIVQRDLLQLMGYCLIAGLAVAFMPFVLGIAKLTDLDSLDDMRVFHNVLKRVAPMRETIKGMLASLGMTIMMSMLPTMLMWIFKRFFYLKAHRWAQLELQRYYFGFLVVFVLLVTAVGSSILATLQELAESPFEIFALLAARMPVTAHFYLNYMCMQWALQGLELTRYLNLIKYAIYSGFCESERARLLSEPEDQDYYGIGSRSARFSLLFITGIVFGSICPLILVLTLINFGIGRAIYGYLLAFAEQRKADLGGDHWAQSLEHVHIGVFIYIVLMTGVLSQRVHSWRPAAISAASFLFWAMMYNKCTRSLQWKKLAFEDFAREQSKSCISPSQGISPSQSDAPMRAAYHQVELEDDVLEKCLRHARN